MKGMEHPESRTVLLKRTEMGNGLQHMIVT